jgi:sulfur-carrier protein adenylyltransferase/sulfurtransferase
MGVLDYFKPVSTWTTEKVSGFIREQDDEAYSLVDVRQPGEYENGHLPGAILIPVGELDERVAELDPAKPTIVYCAAGVRSRAAASILERAGFPEVYSMSGGINAWNGLVAEGFPESGISWFSEAHSLDELTALAWVLEDGTETFYETVAHAASDPEAAALFQRLVLAEGGHKAMIAGLQREISGDSGEINFPALLGGYPSEQVMEGGMRVDEAVAWAEGRGVKEILELAISLEAGSYDRYQMLLRRASYEKSRTLFKALADEEKCHLRLLTELFDKYL